VRILKAHTMADESGFGRAESQLFELVGLPGSGKSTLLHSLVARAGSIHDQQALFENAALYWWRQYSVQGRWLGRAPLRRYALQKYLASEVHTVQFLRQHPALAQMLSEQVACLEAESGVAYLGRLVLLNATVKHAALLRHAQMQNNTTVLCDEHWLQLLTVILNAGDAAAYLGWFERAIHHIPLPKGIIWLSGSSHIVEQRQLARGKVAAMFAGCTDVTQLATAIERRMDKTMAVLEAMGVPVLKLDAVNSIDDNVEQVVAWLAQ
jgi:hypothetical protein